MAVLNYMGASFEDGYVISEKMSTDFVTEVVTKIPIVIPKDAHIVYLNNNIGQETETGSILLEFQYKNDVDEYLESFDMLDDDFEEEVSNLLKKGNETLKTISPGGELVDIKIKINSSRDVDPVILEEWKKNVKKIRKKEEVIQKYSGKGVKFLDNTDTTIVRTSNHKDKKNNVFEGTLIEFYIKRPKPLNIGDKISNRFGAKGVITKIIDESEGVPRGDYSGNIDVFISPAGVIGRKNSGVIKEIYLGKILYFMPKIFSDRLKKGSKIEEVKTDIINIYDLLDSTYDKRIVKSIKNKLSDKNIEEDLLNKQVAFNIIIPPFTIPKFENIQKAAYLLNIPLDEKVFIPAINAWSKVAVPVGIQYMGAMEQLSSDYESTRSIAGYISATGQPTKGKSRAGGQAIGNLDVYGLLTYDAKDVLKELMTVRSDNVEAKRHVISQLRQNGKARMPEALVQGQTQKLFKILMLGQGLEVIE